MGKVPVAGHPDRGSACLIDHFKRPVGCLKSIDHDTYLDAALAILAAREWASKTAVDSASRAKLLRNEDQIQASLNGLVGRLNAFMMLAMWHIEDIRLRYQTKGYFCHLAPIAKWCS
jgi:hypothetical protein